MKKTGIHFATALLLLTGSTTAFAGVSVHCEGLMKSANPITKIISKVVLDIQGDPSAPQASLSIDGASFDTKYSMKPENQRIAIIKGISTAQKLNITLSLEFQNSDFSNPQVSRTTYADFNGDFTTDYTEHRSTQVMGLVTCLEK